MVESKELKKPVNPLAGKKSGDKVKVTNTSKQTLNTSKGAIEAGKSGECTVAELRTYGSFLELQKKTQEK
ncbi:MAG: hypothetical protein DRP85_03335 [Candidatus Makaraimicrobium thalassicum]|nr:MAG: hypothetical protein DRP85_03335 [Candidatus Omnitrophota bacterium]